MNPEAVNDHLYVIQVETPLSSFYPGSTPSTFYFVSSRMQRKPPPRDIPQKKKKLSAENYSTIPKNDVFTLLGVSPLLSSSPSRPFSRLG